MKMQIYRIIAKCNPYNARIHYHGGEVLKYDHGTPVAWVHESGLSLEQAKEVFIGWASAEGFYYDDEIIAAECKKLTDEILYNSTLAEEDRKEYTIEDWKADNRWYDGAGWYHASSEEKLYSRGDLYYRDDVMTYEIEEEK